MPLNWIRKKLFLTDKDVIDVPKIPDVITEYMEVEMIDERSPKPVVTPKKNVMLVRKREVETYPKSCTNCPERRLYHEGNIFKCQFCGLWFCGSHINSHIIKIHGDVDYKVTATDGGSARYVVRK